MSYSRSGNDPLNGINPNPASGSPPLDADPGITPEAANLVTGFGDLWALFFVALPGAIRRGWSWANNTPVRRRANLALASVLLFALAVIGLTGSKDTQPVATVVAAPVAGFTYTVAKDDEHLAAIGKPYDVSRQEMIDANLDPLIVTYTNTICPALNRPPTYFKGFLKDGVTHRDGSYCQLTMYEGTNPAYKGKLLAQDSLKKGDGVIVPCTTASTPLIKACQQMTLAQNVP